MSPGRCPGLSGLRPSAALQVSPCWLSDLSFAAFSRIEFGEAMDLFRIISQCKPIRRISRSREINRMWNGARSAGSWCWGFGYGLQGVVRLCDLFPMEGPLAGKMAAELGGCVDFFAASTTGFDVVYDGLEPGLVGSDVVVELRGELGARE